MAYPTFAGVTFRPTTSGSTRPQVSRRGSYTVTHIPGSDDQVLDNGGLLEQRLRVPCVAYNQSELFNIQSLQGTIGALVFDGTTYSDAFLAECDSPRLYPYEADKPTEYELEFII